MINDQFFDDLHVRDITVISGVRSCGKTVEYVQEERRICGVLYLNSGEAVFYRPKGKALVVQGGEVVLIPKRQKYRLVYTAPSTSFVLVNFNLDGNSNEEVSLFGDFSVLPKGEQTNRIARLMPKFETCGISKTVGAVLRKKELIYRLLGYLWEFTSFFGNGVEVDARIAEGVRLLEESYLDNLPITTIAEASHISVNRFRSLFQKQFGMSPLKYRNSLRIKRAEELLSEGSLTVSEVAYASGFENVGYFCRYYRQMKGEAPGETRKKEWRITAR